MKLTKRQKEILDFISGFIETEGYSPSMGEIASHFKIASLNAVYKHLEALESRGFLRRDANRARSIELASEPRAGVRTIPLMGRVAAGRPIEAISDPESIAIPDELVRSSQPHFVLKVQGDSMIEEHIEDGDYVIVESRSNAVNGEKVIALIDGEEVTLKKLFREEGRKGRQVRLQPANPRLKPQRFEESRVQVQGVVVGVLRRY